jgi:hypothetical protein
VVRQALIWEAAAKKAYARAARWREQLDADARAELAEQGTAPTWRLPDLAMVTLPVSKETVVVADLDRLAKWVQSTHPTEVETVVQVRPAFVTRLLAVARVDGELAVDGEGTVIPGLSVRPGGVPQTLRFTPTPEARLVLGEAAERVLDLVAVSLHLPAPPLPPEGQVPDAA